MERDLNLIYALKNGEIVSISEVEQGLKCGCICPACGSRLVAKKGTKVMHHFAHYSGENCKYGYETSLHFVAKEILSKANRMVIPPVRIGLPDCDNEIDWISAAREITIDKVILEKKFGSIIPDIVLYSGRKCLFVEIFVSHKVDEKKIREIKRKQISAIEIDLSKIKSYISEEELKKYLLEECKEKKWLYNAVSEKYFQIAYQFSERKKIIQRGLALHVDGCPISARVRRGKAYANVIDDCSYCKYRLYSNAEIVFCFGHLQIKTWNDLKKLRKNNDNE